VDADLSSLPDDLDALKAALIATRAEVAAEKARAVAAAAELAQGRALIAHLNLEIETLRRAIYGPGSERAARLLDQLELQLEEAEAATTEDELAAEQTKCATSVTSFARKRPTRKPFPDHLPRERVVIPTPQSCPCCGSAKLSKLGGDITETLEVVPRQWKVIQTVRERFSCRECETITQPTVPFHVTPRGFAGPNLLAMILFEKFGQHQPLNRQNERYAREGVDLSLSTLADQVGERIDAIFDIEREISGAAAEERLAARRSRSVPLVAVLEEWMRAERAKLSRHNAVAKAIDYMLTRWPAFARFLEDGRICLTNNAAERALRGLALGRKSWLFAGSEQGAECAAVMYTLIQPAKLNGIDPQAWLADLLSRMAETPQTRLAELLPWNWTSDRPSRAAA
jgi:transposase